MDQIKAGDSVLHKPSGETWFVLGVNYKAGKLCVAGWPPTIANIVDCELVEKAERQLTDEELSYRNKEFGQNWD